jgi:hypothetical protein
MRIIRENPVILLPMLVEFLVSITVTQLLALFFPQLVASLLPLLPQTARAALF